MGQPIDPLYLIFKGVLQQILGTDFRIRRRGMLIQADVEGSHADQPLERRLSVELFRDDEGGRERLRVYAGFWTTVDFEQTIG